MTANSENGQDKTMVKRETVFISKATPGDDEFVLWLAPRLEAAGYTVFADIICLEAGDRWRKEITGNLQKKAIKMLLCCSDSTLDKNGVQEEIGIAEDVARELQDPRFIIPLRLQVFKKVFGIGELQYVDFVGSWAHGLRDLLDSLESQGVPRSTSKAIINPNWESYKKRLAVKIEDSPEVLTASWLRIASVPDTIRYYQPPGAIDHSHMEHVCRTGPFPAEMYLRGFFAFGSPEEIERDFANVGKFVVHSEHNLMDFLEKGSESPKIRQREARNLVLSIFRKSWENCCRTRGLYMYSFSNQPGFHVTKDQSPLGKRIPWGRQGKRRSSMLRNAAGGRVWQYGVSATPYLWPFPHFRIKARVLFAELTSNDSGKILTDSDLQHRLRRTVCKGWRNKAWHGRYMAFLELLSGESPHIELALSDSISLTMGTNPVFVTSPITTALPDTMPEEAEEQDTTTLGNFDAEEDD